MCFVDIKEVTWKNLQFNKNINLLDGVILILKVQFKDKIHISFFHKDIHCSLMYSEEMSWNF